MTRAVGRFFGHIWGAASKPIPEPTSESTPQQEPRRQVVSRQVEEGEGVLGDKKVVLRRTTIEEVEILEGDGEGKRE